MQGLMKYGSLVGGVGLGVLTALVDYRLPPPGTVRGTWEADFPLVAAVAVSTFVGAVLGGALADALDLRRRGLREDAVFAALRWGVAAAVLFALGPFGDFDNAVRDPYASYVGLLRGFAPGIAATAALIGYALFLKRKVVNETTAAPSSEQN